MPRRFVYLNYIQQQIYYASPRHIRANFARRTGKTAGILAPWMHRAQKSLPGGGGGFVGNSNKQLMARTMPAVVTSWKSMFHLVEGENFIFGKPPARLNYPDPIYKPKDWSATLSFANGFYWTLASLAVIGSLNGRTLSVLCGDEAKFWSKEKLDSECMPALSGETPPYGADDNFCGKNPFYKSTCFVSDASLSSKGNWLEREEAKMDVPIEAGPFRGKTSRQLLRELTEYANRIIDINDAVYAAKQANRKVIVKDNATISRIRELITQVRERHGVFHAGNGKLTKDNLQQLVRYRVLTADDAALIYDADYLMSEDDFIFSRVVMDSPKYREHIRQLRCNTFGYFQGSTIDNIALLGEDYIRQMKLSLPPLVFAISVLGIKMKHQNDGFYYALDVENVHGYIDCDDNGVVDQNIVQKRVSHRYNGKTYEADIETPDFERIGEIDDCRMDGDLRPDDTICIAFDWNSRINWVVAGVVRTNPDTRIDTLYIINSLYVKGEEKIETLLRNFNRYYAPHRRRHRDIMFFYDTTAKADGARYALENQRGVEDFKDTVIRLLTQAGWNVNPIFMGVPMGHDTKYREINNSLKGISFPAIRINREKNEALIISMENAGIKQGYGRDGRSYIQKDKSGEKLPYNPDLDDGTTSSASGNTNVREEFRTDGSDAADSLFIGVKYFRFGTSEVFACC